MSNKIIINGRMGMDMEIKKATNSDYTYGFFSVADDNGFGEKASTNWISCFVATEHLINRIQKMKAGKGSAVTVSGTLTFKPFIDKHENPQAGAKLTVDDIQYLPTNQKKDSNGAAAPSTSEASGVPAQETPANTTTVSETAPSFTGFKDLGPVDDGELPF
jgi:single-stranded DNA-binding protein